MIQAGEFHRENAFAENGKQHVVGAEQADTAFHEDRGEQARIAADVADAFEDGGELHQFAGAQGRAIGGVRLGETSCGGSARRRAERSRR